MKKKNIIKERVLVVASCVALAISIGVSGIGLQQKFTSEAIVYEDGVDVNGTISIGEDDVPLGNSKVSTKKSTKKTTKKIKLKKAATKTLKKTATATKKSSSTKNSTTSQIKVDTTVKTTVVTQQKKGSKTQVATTTVLTTVKTTTTKLESGVISIEKAATNSRADGVVNLFEKLDYTVTINPTVNYTGYFDSRIKSIILKTNDKTTIYHELGHFLAYRAGNVDRKTAFAKVFAAEKSLYKASNKAYVLQNASEYFAESFRNYVEDASTLQKQRPQTYQAIVDALASMR